MTAHLLLGQHIPTLLRPLPPRLHSVVVLVAGVVEAISSFAVAVVVAGISTIVTFSEETARHQYRAGQETHATYHARLASQKGETKGDSTDETRSADQSGLIESAMSTA